eukprot:5903317-Amphidinium_carterae.1
MNLNFLNDNNWGNWAQPCGVGTTGRAPRTKEVARDQTRPRHRHDDRGRCAESQTTNKRTCLKSRSVNPRAVNVKKLILVQATVRIRMVNAVNAFKTIMDQREVRIRMVSAINVKEKILGQFLVRSMEVNALISVKICCKRAPS